MSMYFGYALRLRAIGATDTCSSVAPAPRSALIGRNVAPFSVFIGSLVSRSVTPENSAATVMLMCLSSTLVSALCDAVSSRSSMATPALVVRISSGHIVSRLLVIAVVTVPRSSSACAFSAALLASPCIARMSAGTSNVMGVVSEYSCPAVLR